MTSPVSPVQERVLDAREVGATLRIAGRSHWMDAGRPVAAMERISMASYSGVVDYVPGDLTITVRGGTTLAEVAEITAGEGQWLPLDPFGSQSGTIGATVATASYGPLSHGFGTIRDLALGVEFVTGEGKAVRGGGRVVKNVAGFDLVRLVTGSWGTLGIVTEVSLRLYALPSHRMTVAMEAPTGTRRLAERLTELTNSPVLPFTMELVSEYLARSAGLPGRPMILMELGGNASVVAAQRDILARMGAVVEVTSATWERIRTAEVSAACVFRMSGLPSTLAERWERAQQITALVGGSLMHASISRGTVRCILPSEPPAEAGNLLSAPNDADTIVFETLPEHLWAKLAPSAISDGVSQGIKRAFDPLDILNPGILGPLL
ncbi:MAG: FAD-binding protein [Gemmatimonadales bacterium]